jgi:hypothetical protein
MLVLASVATGAFFPQPDITGMAAAILAANAVRQNLRLFMVRHLGFFVLLLCAA